jgi:hypothetical protein
MERKLFWEASWINGRRTKDVALLIFEISKRKKCAVHRALEDNFWVSQVNTEVGLSLETDIFWVFLVGRPDR